jgi:hypothetical protein
MTRQCKGGIVWRPNVSPGEPGAAKTEAKQRRGESSVGKRRGPVKKWIDRAGVSATVQRRRMARSRARKAKAGVTAGKSAAGAGIRGVGGTGIMRAGARVAAGPVGAVLGVIAITAVVATRMLSGKSFENMGQTVRKALLGDIPEEAMADSRTRQEMASPEVMAAYSNNGGHGSGVHQQLKGIFEMSRRKNLHLEKGQRMFERSQEFQVNSMSDVLVMELKSLYMDMWSSKGGDAEWQKTERLINKAKETGGKRAGGTGDDYR